MWQAVMSIMLYSYGLIAGVERSKEVNEFHILPVGLTTAFEWFIGNNLNVIFTQ